MCVPSSQVIIKPLNSDDLTLIKMQIQCSPFQAVTGKIYRLKSFGILKNSTGKRKKIWLLQRRNRYFILVKERKLLFCIVFNTHTNYLEIRAKLVSVKV